MGVSQVEQSFQNDGNFSQLGLRDVARKGPILRIETFRCSQPNGDHGTTAAGSAVSAIAGDDHLKETSNRTFRHVFSTGDSKKPTATLEIRETYEEDGSMDVRTRDLDARSPSFGSVLLTSIRPTTEGLHLRYEVRRPKNVKATSVFSPLAKTVREQVRGLVDLAAAAESLGATSDMMFDGVLFPARDNAATLKQLGKFSTTVREACPAWAANVVVYERMGDFRDKCIHPGTNLIGDNPALASEFMLIRAYRISLIAIGKIFDPAMSVGADHIEERSALSLDTKPGVYSIFLSAYALNIALYQLGLDKVHSDYGGVPMALRPGSRLETGAKPIVDATNLNRLLALLAGLFYLPAATSQVTAVAPAIRAMGANPETVPAFLR